MSAFVGRFPGQSGPARNTFEVQVSRGGVEITPRFDETGVLMPLDARAMAAALNVAADECERMRAKPET